MRDLTGYIRSRHTSDLYLNHEGDIENEDRNSWHELETTKSCEERRRSQRWKARMRNAILLHLEVLTSVHFILPVGSTPTLSHVQTFEEQCPLLKLYFQDFRISRDSLEALMRCLGPERRQAWGHHITVLMTVYWLAHGTPPTVHRLVHQGVEDIAALRQSLIKLPAGPELEE
ncbi:hypothetical protein F7725_001712, partial [Dissostichus mawsoni]